MRFLRYDEMMELTIELIRKELRRKHCLDCWRQATETRRHNENSTGPYRIRIGRADWMKMIDECRAIASACVLILYIFAVFQLLF